MTVYWIARSKIINAERYWKYAEQVPDMLSRYGAKVLARGGGFHVAEGTDRFNRFVLVEFPSLEATIACYESPEYQEARLHRAFPHGEAEIVMVEGGEFTSPHSLTAASR